MKEYIKTHKKQLIIIAVITLVCLAVLFTAMYFTGVFDNYGKAIKETELPEMSITQNLNDYWSVTITGTVKNVIKTSVKGIVFRFYLLDENGDVMKDSEGHPYVAEDFASDLAPGESYTYNAQMVLLKKPSGFRAVKSPIK